MRKLFIVLILILLAMSTVSGCGGKQPDVESVAIVEKKPEGIEVWGEAKVKTTEEIVIDFPYTVTDVLVKEGQSVKKGDVLLQIDYNDFLKEVNKKEKEISLSSVSTDNFGTDTSAMKKELQSISDELILKEDYFNNPKTDTEYNRLILELENGKLNLDTAKNNIEKNKQLFETGAISKQELDMFVKDLETAEKAKQNTELKIEELKKTRELEIVKLKTEIAAANVKINETNKMVLNINSSKGLKSDIAEIEKQQMIDKLKKIFIEDSKIICSVENGIIQTVSCQKGNIMNTTAEYSKIMTILDMDTLHVVADMPEEFINDVKIGSKAEIIPYADRSQILSGEVSEISHMAVKENGETVVKVEIKLTGKHEVLKSGFTVDVTIF